MISYVEALALIQAVRLPRAKMRMPLVQARGARLAEDLTARIPSPPYTNSAMDGFALRRRDLENGSLAIAGSLYARPVRAGDHDAPPAGTCVRIMTGAAMPAWADTVIPVENAKESAGRVSFTAVPEAGAHIRVEGEDVAAGAPLLRAGTKLDAERLMVAAAFGYRDLLVEVLPRIVVLSTGDELVEPGEPLPTGAIYNSSKTYLLASLASVGLEATAHVVPDDEALAARFVGDLLADERPTVVLSTGAVSAGERDFIPALAARLGLEALLHQVAIRPGKPVFLARRGPLAWLGLPGNPISTAVGWHFFARPLLHAVADVAVAPRTELTLANEVQKPEGLRCFFRAEVTGARAWVAKRQGSAHFGASVSAGAYVVLPEGRGRFPAETRVEAITLHS